VPSTHKIGSANPILGPLRSPARASSLATGAAILSVVVQHNSGGSPPL